MGLFEQWSSRDKKGKGKELDGIYEELLSIHKRLEWMDSQLAHSERSRPAITRGLFD